MYFNIAIITKYLCCSESAHPGAQWPEESTSGQGITDLVASLVSTFLFVACKQLGSIVLVMRKGFLNSFLEQILEPFLMFECFVYFILSFSIMLVKSFVTK